MLRVHHLTKRFEPPPAWLRPIMRVAAKEPVQALEDVSFTAERGEVVGLVGPNGAGKTTLLKLVTGLLVPTSGRVELDGRDPARQPRRTAGQLGVVLEGDRGIYDRLTGRQNLEFFGVMAGLRPSTARRRAGDILDALELSGRDKLAFGYSAGMRMRLSIGRALIGDPKMLILDEPTRSLDTIASRFVVELVGELAGEGRSVLLSTHRLDEIADTCDRVIVLVGGTARYVGDAAALPGARGRVAAALTEFLTDQVQNP